MPYVKRTASGQITAVSATPEDGFEALSVDHPDLAGFVMELGGPENPFFEADRDFVRVIEDLIYLLIDKSILRLTDLPLPVQQKLALRRSLRHQQGDLSAIVPHGEDLPLL